MVAERELPRDIKNATIQIFGEVEGDDGPVWEPIFVATNETKNGNPLLSKPNALAFGSEPGQKRLYVTDAIMRQLKVFEILWDASTPDKK